MREFARPQRLEGSAFGEKCERETSAVQMECTADRDCKVVRLLALASNPRILLPVRSSRKISMDFK